jgi:hypothetical protein
VQRALALLETLTRKATTRTVGRPQAAFRHLLLEHFQADRITRSQG